MIRRESLRLPRRGINQTCVKRQSEKVAPGPFPRSNATDRRGLKEEMDRSGRREGAKQRTRRRSSETLATKTWSRAGLVQNCHSGPGLNTANGTN